MKRVQVLLDEESDRILTSAAAPLAGNRSLAIREVLKMHRAMEALLSQVEQSQEEPLRSQKERSERGFREGKFTTWDQVKLADLAKADPSLRSG